MLQLTLNIFPQGKTMFHEIIEKNPEPTAALTLYEDGFEKLFKKLKIVMTNFEALEDNIQERRNFDLTLINNCNYLTPFQLGIQSKQDGMVDIILSHFDLETVVDD